jgi:hypothetical protein
VALQWGDLANLLRRGDFRSRPTADSDFKDQTMQVFAQDRPARQWPTSSHARA